MTYRFVSPKGAKRPKDLAPGLEWKPNCLIYVTISRSGSQARLLEGWDCSKYKPLHKPFCTPAKIWKSAMKRGAPSNGFADVSYYGFRGSAGRTYFSIPGTRKYSFSGCR